MKVRQPANKLIAAQRSGFVSFYAEQAGEARPDIVANDRIGDQSDELNVQLLGGGGGRVAFGDP
jgi:hypothetical protein